MTEFNHQPPPGDVLDRAAAAVTGQAIPDPPADLLAATLAAVHNRLTLAEAASVARRRRRKQIMRGMSVGGLAACLAVAVTWGGGATAAESLKVALDNQQKAKSFRAVVKTVINNAPAGAKPMEQKLYYQREKVRVEMGDLVTVGDGASGTLLMLDTKAKVARVGTVEVVGRTDLAQGVAAGVKKLLDAQDGKDKVAVVPAVEIGGKRRSGFRVSGVPFGPGQTAEVVCYLDDERKLPLRYELTVAKPVQMTSVTDLTGYDEELDPKLFSLDVPEGYKREELKIPATGPKKEPAPSPAPEQLVEAPKPERTRPVSLRLAAEAVAAAPAMVVTNTQRLLPGRPELTVKLFVRGPQCRMEFPNPGGNGLPDPKTLPAIGALIFDADSDRSLHLNFGEKTAKFEKRQGVRPATFPDLAAGFRQLTDEDGESAGEEQVGDVTAKVYRLKSAKFLGVSGPDVTATVWLDPATSLPLRVKVGDGKMELRFEKFEWPATLSDSLFSLTPPKGYTVGEFVPPGAATKK